jgi:hypothetical protein
MDCPKLVQMIVESEQHKYGQIVTMWYSLNLDRQGAISFQSVPHNDSFFLQRAVQYGGKELIQNKVIEGQRRMLEFHFGDLIRAQGFQDSVEFFGGIIHNIRPELDPFQRMELLNEIHCESTSCKK